MARDFKDRPTVNGTGVLLQGEGAGAGPRTFPLIMDHGAGIVFTNMAAALGEQYTYLRTATDLTAITRVRLVGNVQVAGAASAELRVQYSTNLTDWFYLDGASGPGMAIGTVGPKRTAWVNLVAGAKADVWLRVVNINGDGAADPNIRSMLLQAE